ncbi:ATP-binding protein [Archangium gephyra]|uniref:sensor histidine kinase n=1 Tax=Archangium gephyra TaxID=48 RepID=UPI003B7C1D85
MSEEDERKSEPRSKVALSEDEERFRLLIDSLQDYSVFPLSVDGRVSNWNLGAERLKGFTTEEALGLHISLEAAWVRSALGVDTPERFMALGARSYMCVPLKARGGTFGAITFVSVTRGRSYGPGELALAEEFARRAALAVDNARLFREAQEALKARDEFLSMASHDLRSPLTSLRLQLQAVRRNLQPGSDGQRSTEKLASRVESMERQTDRMLHMMDALLDISQMTAGRLELKRQRVDLVEVVRGAMATLDEELRQSGVQVRVHAEGPVEGRWDSLRLEQVVDNLLSNAVKYGKGQPVDITVSTDGLTARLEVRDQGVGVAPEDQARLFDRFERVRLDRGVTGYGVGLWIVRRVVEAHGGSISIESRLGEGACFIVRLPSRGQARDMDAAEHPPAVH